MQTIRLFVLALAAMTFVAADAAAAQAVTTDVSAPRTARATAQRQQRRGGHFRSGIELVLLDVYVKGRDGRLIETLGPEDFVVLEDERPQRLAFFSPGAKVPLAAVLLIDRSSSMAGAKLDRAKAAAVAFTRTLGSDDRVAILTFNERVVRHLPFSAEPGHAEQAVAAVSPSGGTALFDAMLVALSELERDRRQRQGEFRDAVVVLSDGEDTASQLAFEDVREAVRRTHVLVYVVSLRAEHGRWLPPPYHLSTFAVETGGRAVTVAAPERLAATYREIAQELRHLYRLGYVSSNTRRDGAWRTISVRVPEKDVSVRTRAGYYAGR